MIPASAWSKAPLIELEGSLDIAARPRLKAILERRGRLRRVTFDLCKVDFMDASALGCLVHFYNGMARDPGCEPVIRLTGVRPIVARLLRLVRLDEIFEVVEMAASGPDDMAIIPDALKPNGYGEAHFPGLFAQA
jgi:anti-anti-sigma factor